MTKNEKNVVMGLTWIKSKGRIENEQFNATEIFKPC